MYFRYILLSPLLSILLAATLTAEELPQAQDKKAQAVRVDTPPVIDGVLDDEVWKQATVIDDLHQVRPYEYSEPSLPSEFLVMYDKDALYIGAHLHDDPDKITGNKLKQGDMLLGEDNIFINLDPFNNKRSGYFLVLNVNSVRDDGMYKGPRDMDFDWDGIWHGKASRTTDGWTAEVALPFKSFSFDSDNDTWGFSVGREVARNREMIGWTSRNMETNPSSSGELYGLTGMDLGKGLDVIPSVSLRRTYDYDTSYTDYSLEPSLDVFYQITPSVNGSITINTDFSATEVDARQVNLTRFALFFPEKRDFFLKDSDIFEFGRIRSSWESRTSQVDDESGRPYFSRTIGLSKGGDPVALDYGGKLSGRIGQWDFGAQFIRQASYRSPLPSTNEEEAKFEDFDSTDILVGRVVRNVLEESTIGAIMTHGDPHSDLDNTLFGIDFLYRNTRIQGQTIEAEAWYQQSDTEGLEGDDTAWGLSAQLDNKSKLRGRLSVKELQENFRPALGFVSRYGVRHYVGDVGYTFRPMHDFFREIYTGVIYKRVDELQGDLQSSALKICPLEIENHADDSFKAEYVYSREVLAEDFEISDGVFIPPGTYSFDTYALSLTTGNQRKLSGNASISKGTDYDGDRWELEGGLTWRPSKHFAAEASYTYNDFELPYGDFVTRLMSFQMDIVFSDTLSWTTIAQFDNQSNNLGIHSRLHYIPQAGRELFLVINHDFFDEENGFGSTRSDIVLKVSYTFRF